MQPPSLKLYIAGASAELDRARAVRDWARRQADTIQLVGCDWVAAIDRERREGGRQDHQLTLTERERYAQEDLNGVRDAQMVWLLLPPRTVHTVGLWVEFGFALRCGATVLASGPDEYLFTALAHQHFVEDDQAMDWLLRRPR